MISPAQMEQVFQNNKQSMDQLNRKWELLSQLHMWQIALPPANADTSHSVLAFPLSFIVEKCYNYDPLITLGKATKNNKYAKNLPYGISSPILSLWL